jgi:hypothetical protein
MTNATLDQTTEAAHPAGDPAAELSELFALETPGLTSIDCVTHITNCSNHIICCE